MGGGKTAPSINIDAGKKTVASGGGDLNMTPSYMKVPAYAAGGIISQPHLGLVGEAGREAIIPLEDRNSGLPMLMSAISELGISSNDILPYLNPVAPEIESPSVNLSVPVQPAPVVNVPVMPPIPADINVSPLMSTAQVNVQPTSVNIPPLEQTLSVDLSRVEQTVEIIADRLANQVLPPQSVTPVPAVNVSPMVQASPAVNVLPNTPDVNVAPVVRPAGVSVSSVLSSQPVNISRIERTTEAILASFANLISLVNANAEQPNISSGTEDRMPMPAVNVTPVVSPADVSVQPMLKSSPVVNVPSVNLPEVSATPPNVSVLNDMTALGNVIVQAIKSIDNKNDTVQSQAFNSPLLVQPAPVNVQPPDVFTAPLDLSGFGNELVV